MYYTIFNYYHGRIPRVDVGKGTESKAALAYKRRPKTQTVILKTIENGNLGAGTPAQWWGACPAF